MAEAGGAMGGGEEAAGASMSGGSEAAGASAAGGAGAEAGGGASSGMLAMKVSDSMLSASGDAPASSDAATSIKSPSIDVTGGSTKPANSDITRENPFGKDTTKPQESKEPSTSQKIGTEMKSLGGKMQDQSNSATQFSPSPIGGGSTYGALFGTPNLMARQAPAAMQMPSIQSAPLPPPQMQAPAPIPTMAPPMAPPPPMQLGAVSDERAKTKIRHANADMNAFLNRVYENVTKGKK